jgi:hypothetical protein
MLSAIESMSPFSARRTLVGPKLRAYTAAVVAKLRAVAPYALLELILPGGSVMALLLWLYRRQKTTPVSYRFAVKPTPRRLGAGGFVSSRMAERLAAMAWSCSSSLLLSRDSSCADCRASSLFEPSKSRS